MKSSPTFRTLCLALACAAITFSMAVCAEAQTVDFLANFNGVNGNSPNGLIQATDGNFYGTAYSGGAYGEGTVFRMTPSGALKTIYSFCSGNCSDGNGPYLLVLGSDANLYGVTIYGGVGLSGTVYRLTLGGEFTLLHTFCSDSTCSDGKNPNGFGLGSDGSFYGTTAYGGEFNNGVFFQIGPTGKFKVLHSFCALSGCLDGSFPLWPIQGQDGNFYGTAARGGTQGGGVIYKLSPSGDYQVIHNFCSQGNCADGGVILPLVQDAKGNFFGVTSFGGAHGSGTVFELTAERQFKILHSFDPSVDGDYPNAGLALANDGNLYGVNLDGKYGDGTAYEITPEGIFTLLYTFDVSGNAPYVPLFQGTDGLLYGSTDPYTGSSNGTIFSLSNGLSPLVETVPTAGKVRQRILILGNDLTGTTSVTFNGVPAEFKVEKDSFIRATVPEGTTTGTVSVVTPSGTLNSNPQFVVTK